MKKIFKPAITVMNRLKYPQKFSLISCVFVLPLSLVMYLLISEIQLRNDFTAKEISGNMYLRPVRQLWADITRLKLTSYGTSTQNEIKQIKSQINTKIESLEAIDGKLGQTLLTTDKFNALKQTWQKLRKNQDNSIFEGKNPEEKLIRQQINQLIAHVGDKSNLILDPDLDTYYLMDATLLKLPQIERTLVDIQSLTKRETIGYQATPAERAQLIIFLGNLKDYNEELKRNMEVAFNNNPAGNLGPSLTNSLDDFTKQIDLLTKRLELLVDTEVIKDPVIYFREAEKSLNLSFNLWDKTIQEQDLLLQYRIDGFARKQILLSIFVLTILALVLYLFVGFYLGVIRTVATLSTASKQMIDGSIIESISLDNRDELGEVVHSFNNIALALVQTNQKIGVLNKRLENENTRMGAELEITSKLQQMILPKEEELKNIPGLDIAGFMKAADEIGGDYYDVLQQDGRVKIGIGDVTGHGLESGVLMIMVQTAVRTLLESHETDPKKFLSILNRTIYQNVQRMQSDKSLTLCLLDYEDGMLRVSGQHEEMIVVRQGKEVERIDTMDLGFPIGLEEDITDFIAYTDVKLDSGDVVVLYTDGIIEAENIGGIHYGLERLIELIKENSRRSAHQIRHAVLSDVRHHIGEQKVFDDITLVVLKQKPTTDLKKEEGIPMF
jgi:serine phosphatase RsbU (regulator of sigma subunit)